MNIVILGGTETLSGKFRYALKSCSLLLKDQQSQQQQGSKEVKFAKAFARILKQNFQALELDDIKQQQ